MLGFLIVLASTASLGLTAVSVRRGVLRGSPMTGTFIAVLVGVPLYIIAVALAGHFPRLSGLPWSSIMELAATGILQLVLGRYCFYRSISALGANQAELVQTLQVPVSVLVGLAFLRESLTPASVVALLLIMVGPGLVIVGRGAALGAGIDSARAKEGMLFGLAAVVAFVAGDGLARAALAGTGLGLAGGMVAYLAAGVILAPTVALSGQLETIRGSSRSTLGWFSLGAFLTFLAQVTRYLALAVAPVTLVVPLMRTVPVFVLVFSFLLNRRVEVFGTPVVAGVFFTVTGMVVLAL